jgi:hypothetical protein
MPSDDVVEMKKLLDPLICSRPRPWYRSLFRHKKASATSVDAPDTSTKQYELERRNLAAVLLRMYTDLDKTVRRSDEGGKRSKWTVRVGSAATAAASAVAGTTLVSGSTGTVAIVVGAVTASLGVIGSVVAALKLQTSITNNQANHAQYLPLFRQLSTYAAVGLFKDDVEKVQSTLNTFATNISKIEAADAAAEAAAAAGGAAAVPAAAAGDAAPKPAASE